MIKKITIKQNERKNNMQDTLHPTIDFKIRSALKDADQKGKLEIVSAVTGIAGGVSRLRELMNSKEELSIMDRGMLGIHLL